MSLKKYLLHNVKRKIINNVVYGGSLITAASTTNTTNRERKHRMVLGVGQQTRSKGFFSIVTSIYSKKFLLKK